MNTGQGEDPASARRNPLTPNGTVPSASARARSSGLNVPTSSMRPPNTGGLRGKVALKPGHSQLDWARLSSSGKDLRGIPSVPIKVTPHELSMHRTRDDAWMALNGRVYNVTKYLDFHPGGVPQIMRAAGRDGTELFVKTHSWVNAENMLRSCFLGFLVAE